MRPMVVQKYGTNPWKRRSDDLTSSLVEWKGTDYGALSDVIMVSSLIGIPIFWLPRAEQRYSSTTWFMRLT